MKKPLAMALLILVLLFAGCAQQQASPPAGGAGTGGSYPPAATQGRAVFTIADKAADMGAVTSVKVTVDSVSVQSATKGWVTVSTAPHTYDLLQLKASGNQQVLADSSLDQGAYSQARLQISSVMVTDASGEHEAKLPSGDMKIEGNFNVDANSTSAVSFDFLADKSLHVTGKGEYILAPVVHMQARERAQVSAGAGANVQVSGGTLTIDKTVGMDENGTVGVNVQIPAGADLSIGSGGGIMIGAMNAGAKAQGRLAIGIGGAQAGTGGITSLKLTVESISAQSSENGWVTVSSMPKTYDLVQLQGREELAADANLDAGTYNQIRLVVSKATVTDANGEHEAVMPSGELKILGNVEVEGNQTATVSLDFFANDSVRETGNSEYIVAPEVRLETRRNAQAQVNANNELYITGGTVVTSTTVGMNEKGEVGVGLGLPENIGIGVGNGLVIRGNGSAGAGLGLGYG
ncbi:MAG: DUF4382 domain-containing protein [Candidatus Micrarchaeia archaeon]